jgi:hypothetical protein
VAGTVTSGSDRNTKENFSAVDPQKVLDKIAAIPIQRWSYKHDPGTPHIGPMAQDFHAAFGVGPDNEHITMVDADGVAFAAIQALHEHVKTQDSEISKLQQENSRLKDRLDALEKKHDNLDARIRAP